MGRDSRVWASGNGRREQREALLTSWTGYIVEAAARGALTGRVCPISRVEMVSGPRAGAIEMLVGLEAGRLLRALSRDGGAILRQFVPWKFTGTPQVFMNGRYLRLEAGWPRELEERLIRLDDLGQHPAGGGQWTMGMSEMGATIIAGLNDRTAHFLVSGTTGSGKSVALQSAVLQLSRDAENTIVLVDGKMGESLKAVERLDGVMAPCAVDGPQARAALGWAVSEMLRRYQVGEHEGRVIVVVDEFQELARDVVVADLLRKLTAQGRAAGVHCVLATQHPTVGAFGDAGTRRNLTGKIALRVDDSEASRVAVGGRLPRADHLLDAGDSYAVGPGVFHRVQLAFVDEGEIGAAGYGSWRLARWPEYDAEEMGQELPEVGWTYSGDELAVSVVAAAKGEGRPSLVRRLEEAELGRPGAERAIRLLRLGRDTNDWLERNRYFVCLSGDAGSDGGGERVQVDVW